MKEYEMKTALSEGHYKAALEVIDAKGFTQAGYVRHLILQDVIGSQELVSQMNQIAERAINGQKPAELGLVQSKG